MASVKFEGKQFPLLAGETVLQALLRGGANVPSSCRKGSCQTCLMRLGHGQVKHAAGNRLHPALSATGHFLPCVATSEQDLEVERPYSKQHDMRVRVAEKRMLSGGVVQLKLEPEAILIWRAGQHLEVRSPTGAYRRYSIASCPPGDRLLELHIARQAGGFTSSWLCDEVNVGDTLWVRAPQGRCHYDRSLKTRPLLLIATATGLAPLLGVVRHALRDEHEGPLYLYHEAKSVSQLYAYDVLAELVSESKLQFFECTLQEAAQGQRVLAGHASERAFEAHPDLSGYAVFIAGDPDAVDATRVEAVRRGADRHLLFAEPFTSPVHGLTPKRSFEPDLELWRALGFGTGMRAVLEQFYTKAYCDPLLAPLLRGVALERAILEHSAFLEASFSGTRPSSSDAASESSPLSCPYPTGAYEPIITDDLFDHWESLLEACMREHALPEAMLRRWCAFDESFRREVVSPPLEGLSLDASQQRI